MDNPYTLASGNIGHTYTGKWQHWAHKMKTSKTQKKMNNTEPIKN